MCGKHPEKRIPALLICEVTVSLVRRLTFFLKEANLLSNDDNIEGFLYKAHKFNTAQNLSLVILWDFMYKARFSNEKYPASRFFSYLNNKISWVQLLAPNLKSEFSSLSNALLKCQAIKQYSPDI